VGVGVVVVVVYLYGATKTEVTMCLGQVGFKQPQKCNKFNVRLTEFGWQSVPKPWTDNSEVPVVELGVPFVMCAAHHLHQSKGSASKERFRSTDQHN